MTNHTNLEIKHITHVYGTDNNPDFHIVKEVITTPQGRIPNLRIIKNYKRPYWVVKSHLRDSYTDKREWEHVENCIEGKATDTDLYEAVRKTLGIPKQKDAKALKRVIDSSPYVYGLRTSASTLIFQKYRDKYPEITPYTVCAFDTETTAIHGDFGEIFIAQAAFQGQYFVCYLESWLPGDVYSHYNKVKRHLDEAIGDRLPKDYYLQLMPCKDTLTIIRTVFAWIHSHQPDILAIWNAG